MEAEHHWQFEQPILPAIMLLWKQYDDIRLAQYLIRSGYRGPEWQSPIKLFLHRVEFFHANTSRNL